jgi:sugar phosphate isomerase/epimerase
MNQLPLQAGDKCIQSKEITPIMNPKLGLQLWSVRNALAADTVGTLEKIAEIGYVDLQINPGATAQGLDFGNNINAVEMRKHLDHLGLKCVSLHIVPDANTNWEKVVADCHTVGASSLACAIAFFENRQQVLDFCKDFNVHAEFTMKNGVPYYYHNHFHEFQIFEGQTIFDTMIENLDKDLVPFELDTYWAARGGADPIALMRRLGKRCSLLHQKDLPAEAQPVNWFDKFGQDGKISLDDMWSVLAENQFTEIGEGILDISAYIETARTYCNVEYVFVEQDMTKLTELESIAVSLKNFKRLLEGA